MHKKLATDLTSLAHSILRMKDRDDVFALKEKAHEIYEKLALLAYVEEYINTTPSAEYTKDELIAKIIEAEALKESKFKDEVVKEVDAEVNQIANEEELIEEVLVTDEKVEDVVVEARVSVIDEVKEDVVIEEKSEAIDVIEQPFDEIQKLLFGDLEPEEEIEVASESVLEPEEDEPIVIDEEESFEEVETVEESDNLLEGLEEKESTKVTTLEEELGDTISVDVMANLFEKVEPKKTLHDKLQNTIRIDLNDRIAFVKNLFDGSQEDFNRVISQLNTKNSEMEAKNFIQKMIKPDYDWSDKEEYELRLMEIIERKFIV